MEAKRELWLAGLKPGDEVAYYPSSFGDPEFVKIDRRTATQIVVGQKRFNAKNGHEITSSSRRSVIHPLTDDVRADMEDTRIRRLLSNKAWARVPSDVLRRVEAVLKQAGQL